mgnify:CR=1 FL=1
MFRKGHSWQNRRRRNIMNSNAASYGYIDDIIEPRNTRFRVIRALEQLAVKAQEMPWKKHDNMPL